MAALAAAALAGGCGSERSNRELPVAAIGADQEAEKAFRPLLRRWQLATNSERTQLEPELLTFVRQFEESERDGGGGLVRRAQVLLAWNAMLRAELRQARALASDAALGEAGVTRDMGLLVLGAVARREGKHQEALDRLTPLLHKMLDGFATALLNEELVQAAMAAQRYDLALRFMEIWQQQAEPGSERATQQQVAELLRQLPKDALLAELKRRTKQIGSRDLDEDEMSRLLAQQLARQAVEQGDGDLARLLLAKYGGLLGGAGEAVAKLAAQRQRGQVVARTVGLLLPLRSRWQRRRSADVAAGVAFGLGIPGSAARLVSRPAGEDDNATRQALAELASEGAAVIVAGLSADDDETVIDFAAARSLPLVLLTAPDDPNARSPRVRKAAQNALNVFELGLPRSVTLQALAAQLREDGAKSLLVLADEPLPKSTVQQLAPARQATCEGLSSAAAAATPQGVLLLDGSFCAAPAVRYARQARARLALGSGLSRRKLASSSLQVRLGIFPVDGTRPDPRLTEWLGSGREAPSWWTALGRDAAVLAWEAVKDLDGRVTDDREVSQLRLQITGALASARVPLWTSASRGFDSRRQLPRKPRVVRVNGQP